MEQTIKIKDAFKLNSVIYKIIKQQVNISASNAFSLYKLHKNLNEIENFVFERISLIYGDNFDFYNMSDEQKVVYDAVMNSDITLDVPNINVDELTNNDKLQMKIEDFEILDFIFKL